MTERNTIDISDLPEYMQRREFPDPCPVPAVAFHSKINRDEDLLSMQAMELKHLHCVLEHVGGDRERAAEILQIGRTTVYRLLKRIDSTAVV